MFLMIMHEDSNKLHPTLVVRHQTIIMHQIIHFDMISMHLIFKFFELSNFVQVLDL